MRWPAWPRPAGFSVKKVGANTYCPGRQAARRSRRRAAEGQPKLVHLRGAAGARAPTGTAGHRRHRQQARHAVAALPGPMVADRWRRICAAGRCRHRGDRGSLGRLFLDPSRRRAATSCSSAASPIPASAARPSRRSANISATCAPATAGPIPTSSWSTCIRSKSSKVPRGRSTGRARWAASSCSSRTCRTSANFSGIAAIGGIGRPGMAILGYDASAVFNAPLGDNAALRAGRLSCARRRLYRQSRHRREGHQRRRDHRRPGDASAPSWFPAGSSILSGIAQRIDGDDSQYADEEGSGLSRDSLVDQPFSSDFTLASLVIRKDSGPIRFRSTTGASWQDVDENFDASIGRSTSASLRQHSEARAVSNETRLWRPMADGYSWLVGFSSIVHRYEVVRDMTEEGAVIDLAGVENRVRETTIYGEVGLRTDPRGSKPASARRYTVSDPVRFGRASEPAGVRQAGRGRRRAQGASVPSVGGAACPADRRADPLRPLSAGLPARRPVDRQRYGPALSQRPAGNGGSGLPLRPARPRPLRPPGQRDAQPLEGHPGRFPRSVGPAGHRQYRRRAGVDDHRQRRRPGHARASAGGGRRLERRRDHQSDATPSVTAGRAPIPDDRWKSPISPGSSREARSTGTSELGGDWRSEANAYARYVGRSRLGIGPHLGEEQGEYLDSGLILRLSDRAAGAFADGHQPDR